MKLKYTLAATALVLLATHASAAWAEENIATPVQNSSPAPQGQQSRAISKTIENPKEGEGRDAVGSVVIDQKEYNLYLLEKDIVSEQISAFNKDIKNRDVSGKIVSCKRMIEISIGVADGNHSYGGTCLLENNKKLEPIMICHDALVGHFQMIYLRKDEISDIYKLSSFVTENCYGG